jgi:sigma-B regulation protein RsbU (phosphoserine phosphatase)
MRCRLRSSFVLPLVVLLLATVTPCARTQTAAELQHPQDPRHYDATRTGEVVDLGPYWLFQTGDDPAFAASDFDDSKWPVITTNKSMASQGYRDLNQIWYRVHMHVRPDSGPLVLGITAFGGSYEIFVNGVRIGGQGSVAGRGEFRVSTLILFGIPKEAVRSGELTIALHRAVGATARATESSGAAAGYGRIMIGGPVALAPLTFESYIRHVWLDWVDLVLISFVVFVVLALYRVLPDQKEYLIIALCGGFQLLSVCATFIHVRLLLSFSGMVYGVGVFANAAFLALQVEVVLRLVGLRPARWIRALQGVLILSAPLTELSYAGITPVWVQHTLTSPALIVLYLAVPVYLFREMRRGNRDAPVLFAFQIVFSATGLLNEAGYYLAKAQVVTMFNQNLIRFDVGQFTIVGSDIATIYFWVTLLVILVLRTVRIARERAEIAAEVEAARTVQQMLIPAVPPVTPGFAVESVYLPARQVGGDFFLVVPSGDGSLLIVTGDVSGKGLQAAMVVSTILGALRNESSRSPATVLANLNQVLLGQVRGFVTCTAALIAPDGRIALANAGNPAPYLNGRELAVSAGLPLGMVAGIGYEETAGQLARGETLTFISDGVVEATAPVTRELFGFERTQAISKQAANSIAEAARAFGVGAPQADDITVLTVARAAA